jgi:hypothetical protein
VTASFGAAADVNGDMPAAGAVLASRVWRYSQAIFERAMALNRATTTVFGRFDYSSLAACARIENKQQTVDAAGSERWWARSGTLTGAGFELGKTLASRSSRSPPAILATRCKGRSGTGVDLTSARTSPTFS